jgi:hypothetical protein
VIYSQQEKTMRILEVLRIMSVPEEEVHVRRYGYKE